MAAAAVAALALFAFVPALLFGAQRPACLDLRVPAPHDGMVWVPAGDYAQGDTVYPEEGPLTRTHVSGFWMDRHEVTNAEFARFVAATGYVTEAERGGDVKAHPGIDPDLLVPGAMVFFMPKHVNGMEDISQWWRFVPGANWRRPAGPSSSIAGKEDFPVVEITHVDALAYAKWKGHALPTEAEWEWAARAGDAHPGDDHDQPVQANTWQGIFPVLNSGADGFVGLAPVGCYGANKYGLFDMFGNVWEMTADLWRPHHGDESLPDTVPARGAGVSYTIKGGSFLCAPNYCMRYRSGSREPQESDLGTSHVGFRTILREKSVSP
jgi:formylglycine-generating enzyme required for sulfatase activity